MVKHQSMEGIAPWAELAGKAGRGLAVLFAFTLPFHGHLEGLAVAGLKLPWISLLGGLIVLSALVQLSDVGQRVGKVGWLLVGLLLLSGLASLGAINRGGSFAASLQASWRPLLLAASMGLLYRDEALERSALLVTLVLSGAVVALLGLAEAMALAPVERLLALLPNSTAPDSLLPRARGPLPGAESFSWLMAVLMPIVAAGALAMEGKRRELLLLLLGLLWAALLASDSLTAPVAALIGLLAVVLSVRERVRPQLGLSATLVLVTLVALLDPAFRVRWSSEPNPVELQLRSLHALDGAAQDDSLQLTLFNPGPLAWRADFETGYHILYPQEQGELVGLDHATWVGQRLGQRVPAGEQVQVTLPFKGARPLGFLTPDLRGRGSFLAAERPLPYVLLYRGGRAGSAHRVNTILTLDNPGYGLAARQAVARGTGQMKPHLGLAWSDAMTLSRARPIVGLGAGAPRDLVGNDTRSLYLETLVTHGWVGLVLLTFFAAMAIVALHMRGSFEAAALTGALFALLVHGLAAYAHGSMAVSGLSALLAGLALAILAETPAAGPEA